jgi:hypothetical protein
LENLKGRDNPKDVGVDGRIKVMLPLATPGHMKAYRGNSVRLH